VKGARLQEGIEVDCFVFVLFLGFFFFLAALGVLLCFGVF